jgi:hypothetical protein
VLALVLGESAAILGFAIPVGLAGALGVTRFIRAVLWGVTTTDRSTFVAATCLLPVVTIFATLAPAARALQLNPRQVLYEESAVARRSKSSSTGEAVRLESSSPSRPLQKGDLCLEPVRPRCVE